MIVKSPCRFQLPFLFCFHSATFRLLWDGIVEDVLPRRVPKVVLVAHSRLSTVCGKAPSISCWHPIRTTLDSCDPRKISCLRFFHTNARRRKRQEKSRSKAANASSSSAAKFKLLLWKPIKDSRTGTCQRPRHAAVLEEILQRKRSCLFFHCDRAAFWIPMKKPGVCLSFPK